MITNASSVEGLYIHHIKECVLLSCVASFEDWSNIFRTWSFTLCKNVLDFNDLSDFATVLESISSSSMTNLSVCCANKPGGCSLTRSHCSYFHKFIRFPLLRRPILVSIPLWVIWWVSVVSLFFDVAQSTSSEVIDFHTWFFPRAFWCSRR